MNPYIKLDLLERKAGFLTNAVKLIPDPRSPLDVRTELLRVHTAWEKAAEMIDTIIGEDIDPKEFDK